MNNLLAQRKEIKRSEKEYAKRLAEEEESERERGEEEKERAVLEFETLMTGMEGGRKKSKQEDPGTGGDRKHEQEATRGVKRKFEIDEDEMLKNAKAERIRARQALDEEKVRFQSIYISLMCGRNDTVPSKHVHLF